MGDTKLGKTLKKARLEKCFTQKELAEKVGINSNWYSRLERGEEKASLKKLEIIFKILGLKMPAPFN